MLFLTIMIENVGGVNGFSVLLDAITPELEYELFHSKSLFKENNPDKKYFESSHTLLDYPEVITNLLLELSSGLNYDYPIPDLCVPISYPINSSFSAHFDSRHLYGEYIMVVNLGEMAKLYLTLDNMLAKSSNHPVKASIKPPLMLTQNFV